MENVNYCNGRQVLILVAGVAGGRGRVRRKSQVIDVYDLHTIKFILLQ